MSTDADPAGPSGAGPLATPGADGGDHGAAWRAAVVRDAYWYGTRLIHHGWIIREVGVGEWGGYFAGETPRGRAVTVDAIATREVGDDLAAQFAESITDLAAAGAVDGHDYLGELVELLAGNTVPRRPANLRWRTWRIPTVPPCRQPSARVRAAYWFAATLTDDYGWELCEVGSATARGGFIADIPGEAMVIYPADMPDDRTTASALALLLAVMAAPEIRELATLVGWHGAARAMDRRRRSGGR